MLYKKVRVVSIYSYKAKYKFYRKEKQIDTKSHYETHVQLMQHTHFRFFFSKSSLFFLNCLNRQSLSKSPELTHSTNLKKIVLKIRMLHIVSIYSLPYHNTMEKTNILEYRINKCKLILNTDLCFCYKIFSVLFKLIRRSLSFILQYNNV